MRLADGFGTNRVHELVYTATHPTVARIGFAATRAVIAFLRDRTGDGPANPLGRTINSALTFGSSQSGR